MPKRTRTDRKQIALLFQLDHAALIARHAQSEQRSIGNYIRTVVLLDLQRRGLLDAHFRIVPDKQPAELPTDTALVERFRSAVA